MSRASLPRRTMTPERAQAMAAGFLARRRAMHGTATMTAPPQTDPPETDDPPKADPPKTDDPPKSDDAPKPQFTQADLDRVIGERLAAEQAKWQKKIDDAAALAGKSEAEKYQIERDQAKAEATETTQKAAQRIARTEAKGVARDLDARPDRLDAILKQADLSKAVKDDGEVDEAAVKAAVEKVLADYPEWKKTAGGPSASGGELNGGGGGGKPTFTRKQLEDMPPQEMADRIDEINEAFADGRVTG